MRIRRVRVRLPKALYRASLETAKSLLISMGALVKRGLISVVREQEQSELYDAFTLAGEDAEESDVGYAIYAQSEVMLGDQ